MTQQSAADDSGDDAAEDVAADNYMCSKDLPGDDKAASGRVFGTDPVLTRRQQQHRKDAMPMEMSTDLARLQSAFPAFSFAICRGRRGPRFEAWRDTTRSGLYAIITDDPGELWRELDMAPR